MHSRSCCAGSAGGRGSRTCLYPLGVVAADILLGREIVFRSGLLWRAVLASGSMPIVYPAQRIGPHVLVDGGIVNPVPASVVSAMGADVTVGVRLGASAPARGSAMPRPSRRRAASRR